MIHENITWAQGFGCSPYKMDLRDPKLHLSLNPPRQPCFANRRASHASHKCYCVHLQWLTLDWTESAVVSYMVTIKMAAALSNLYIEIFGVERNENRI